MSDLLLGIFHVLININAIDQRIIQINVYYAKYTYITNSGKITQCTLYLVNYTIRLIFEFMWKCISFSLTLRNVKQDGWEEIHGYLLRLDISSRHYAYDRCLAADVVYTIIVVVIITDGN